jgi:hypothetical protein
LQWQSTNDGIIELDVPAGSVCEFITSTGINVPSASSGQFSGRFFARGIRHLRVVGYGATFDDANGTGAGYFVGSLGQSQDSAHDARVYRAFAGATSVQLLDPTQSALFPAGNYVVLTGFDLMGYGYPSNQQYFEFLKVLDVNSTTGVVTFSSPLMNSYLSTWPLYYGGSPTYLDQGGPATLYALDPNWDIEVEFYGLTLAHTGQLYGNGHRISFTDVTFSRGCAIPSETQTWIWNHSTCGDNIEADKLVDAIIFNGGSLGSIDFQSSSIKFVQADNLNVLRYWNGTPQKAIITNSHLAAFRAGPLGYGRTDEIIMNNTVIDQFDAVGVGAGNTGVDIRSYMSMNNGVISVPNSMGPQPWAVPGTQVFFSGSYSAFPGFIVKDVSQDAANTYISTTWQGGWPSPSWGYQGTYLSLHDHPAPKFTCTGCSGASGSYLATLPAGSPLFTYGSGSASGNFGSGAWSRVWGKIKTLKINVTVSYSGSQSALDLSVGGQHGIFVVNPDQTISRIYPTINMKIPGERVITPLGVTGVQPGDDLSSLVGVWIPESFVLYLPDIGSDPRSTWPAVNYELTTDQGFGP